MEENRFRRFLWEGMGVSGSKRFDCSTMLWRLLAVVSWMGEEGVEELEPEELWLLVLEPVVLGVW